MERRVGEPDAADGWGEHAKRCDARYMNINRKQLTIKVTIKVQPIITN